VFRRSGQRPVPPRLRRGCSAVHERLTASRRNDVPRDRLARESLDCFSRALAATGAHPLQVFGRAIGGGERRASTQAYPTRPAPEAVRCGAAPSARLPPSAPMTASDLARHHPFMNATESQAKSRRGRARCGPSEHRMCSAEPPGTDSRRSGTGSAPPGLRLATTPIVHEQGCGARDRVGRAKQVTAAPRTPVPRRTRAHPRRRASSLHLAGCEL
jgi:hypothetical protein